MQRQSQPQGRDTDGIQDSVEKRRKAKSCRIDFFLFLYYYSFQVGKRRARTLTIITALYRYYITITYSTFSFYPLTFFLNPACLFFLFLWTIIFFAGWVFNGDFLFSFLFSLFIISGTDWTGLGRAGLGWIGGSFFIIVFYVFVCIALLLATLTTKRGRWEDTRGNQKITNCTFVRVVLFSVMVS